MIQRFKTIQITSAALLCVVIFGVATIAPARADGAASTRNIILGAAALAVGLTIASNVAHKEAQANTIAGYTAGGAAVYNDGHVVLPNGQSYYPGNYGQTIACNAGECTIGGGYGPYGYNNLGARYRRTN
jgi:hypothetical protein